MGKGRDKRKKAKGSQSGQGSIKTTKKTEQNQEKATRRAEKKAEVGSRNLGLKLASSGMSCCTQTRELISAHCRAARMTWMPCWQSLP